MKTLLSIGAFLLCQFLVSCGTSPRVFDPYPEVYLDPHVDINSQMCWPDEGVNLTGMMLEGLAAPMAASIAYSAAPNSEIGLARGAMAQHQVASRSILAAESMEDMLGWKQDKDLQAWFEKELLRQLKVQLESRRRFVLTSKQQPTARLKISVPSWGFICGLSSKSMQSFANLELTMLDPSGTIIWEESARDIRTPGNPLRKMASVERAALIANPELRKRYLAATALNVAQRIADEIPLKK